jgi:putative phosphoribosyl transferase
MVSERKIIKVKVDFVELEGELTIPEQAGALVIFSHGSGSSRFSPRNNFVAQQLQRIGIATFLFDLLTEDEDEVYANRFDIQLLAHRLVEMTRELTKRPPLRALPIGYFGASTGAASALVAAAMLKNKVAAVVSRGGRPDLADNYLYLAEMPTLLIVGELDTDVMELNRQALAKLPEIKSLQVVKGATHLFEEPGTLEEVAMLAAQWFAKYLLQKETAHDANQAILS